MKKRRTTIASLSHIDRVTNEAGLKILGGNNRGQGFKDIQTPPIKVPPIKDDPWIKVGISVTI